MTTTQSCARFTRVNALNRREPLPAKLAVLAAAALLAGSLPLAGCAPIIAVAAVGTTAMVVSDRRSTGAQVDDQTIEMKLANDLANKPVADAHVNATSFNGIVLLTGEAPTQKVMDEIVAIAKSANRVREVHNEMVVAPASDFSARSNDSIITSKVKSRLIEQNSVPANHVKVVTERGVVYLMGIVTRAEADSAAGAAASTSGVARVVKVFEYSG